jgi:hypothetical protein
MLIEDDRKWREWAECRGESVAGGEDEVAPLACQCVGEGSGDCEAALPGLGDRHRVAIAAEGEQRLDFVIAVRSPRADIER